MSALIYHNCFQFAFRYLKNDLRNFMYFDNF